eukprot:4514721-Pyramimonas_sp.AAC.2
MMLPRACTAAQRLGCCTAECVRFVAGQFSFVEVASQGCFSCVLLKLHRLYAPLLSIRCGAKG